MSRRRVRLVPENAIEIFEIRIALYFDDQGRRMTAPIVSSPDEPDLETVDLIELNGALTQGAEQLRAVYQSDVVEE